MSTITVAAHGDVELARLLASAASCGWEGDADLLAVAHRCEWPARVVRAVSGLSNQQKTALASDARLLLAAFARPDEAHGLLRSLIEACRITMTARGVEAIAGDPGEDVAASAAVGLINLIASDGQGAAAICAWQGCDQPLVRVGRHRASVACSPRCANRIRVSRHRRGARAAM